MDASIRVDRKMRISHKHITCLKIAGFVLMIGAMILLNNQQEKAKFKNGRKSKPEAIYNPNNTGTAPTTANIPEKTEGTLPLKLISNPHVNFLTLYNNSQISKEEVRFGYLHNSFLDYCHKIQYKFIIEFLATIRSKDYH